jgi:hypothetical protein
MAMLRDLVLKVEDQSVIAAVARLYDRLSLRTDVAVPSCAGIVADRIFVP